jgi:hypothetical protein
MLSYILRLEPNQLSPPSSGDFPLMVIDDCSCTGKRFRIFLKNCSSTKVVFATLYSNPALRAALVDQEPRVLACFSARDLQDYSQEPFALESKVVKAQELSPSQDRAYWFGLSDYFCFSWKEPDWMFWNLSTKQVESGWHLVPAEFCLDNNLEKHIPIQVLPDRTGKLQLFPSIVYAFHEGQLVMGNIITNKNFILNDIAKDFWMAIMDLEGDEEKVINRLLLEYDVKEDVLRNDLKTFMANLIEEGILQELP